MLKQSNVKYIYVHLYNVTLVEALTWHRLSPAAHSRTHCCHWSGSKWALRLLWAGGHRSLHPPIHQNARNGSGKSQHNSFHPTPDPSSQESPVVKDQVLFQSTMRFEYWFVVFWDQEWITAVDEWTLHKLHVGDVVYFFDSILFFSLPKAHDFG